MGIVGDGNGMAADVAVGPAAATAAADDSGRTQDDDSCGGWS